ncbi:XAC0095 family protein [Noviluteimonas gilva]|uniref:XAC0095-like domain-containing protein n=1 Tax=Noviluteimonas gilva TaxID=2682097 RepID=A0A7C9LQJ4_9GAMM|nr:hypothetical protein [Lysobacter gilvus]MUV15503.1 hypothetical protein [Lysobacter gilvus]
MRKSPGAQHAAPIVYTLPEYAHVELIQLRDHLRLMAQLTECGGNASRLDARLRPDALAWWFSRLSRDVGWIVAATTNMAEAAAPATARKRKTRKSEQGSPA